MERNEIAQQIAKRMVELSNEAGEEVTDAELEEFIELAIASDFTDKGLSQIYDHLLEADSIDDPFEYAEHAEHVNTKGINTHLLISAGNSFDNQIHFVEGQSGIPASYNHRSRR